MSEVKRIVEQRDDMGRLLINSTEVVRELMALVLSLEGKVKDYKSALSLLGEARAMLENNVIYPNGYTNIKMKALLDKLDAELEKLK